MKNKNLLFQALFHVSIAIILTLGLLWNFLYIRFKTEDFFYSAIEKLNYLTNWDSVSIKFSNEINSTCSDLTKNNSFSLVLDHTNNIFFIERFSFNIKISEKEQK